MPTLFHSNEKQSSCTREFRSSGTHEYANFMGLPPGFGGDMISPARTILHAALLQKTLERCMQVREERKGKCPCGFSDEEKGEQVWDGSSLARARSVGRSVGRRSQRKPIIRSARILSGQRKGERKGEREREKEREIPIWLRKVAYSMNPITPRRPKTQQSPAASFRIDGGKAAHFSLLAPSTLARPRRPYFRMRVGE